MKTRAIHTLALAVFGVAASFSGGLVKADIMHDRASTSGKDIRLAPNPGTFNGASPPANAAPTTGSSGEPSAATLELNASAQQTVFAAALDELGNHLLRSLSTEAGNANSNLVVSPYSLANALGLLHAGAAGATARDIAHLLESGPARGRLIREQIRQLNQSFAAPRPGIELISANRLWIDRNAAKEVSKPFAALVAENYRADGVSLSFQEPVAAAASINQWAAQATRGMVPKLLEPSSLPSSTRLVLTNVTYFKGRWNEAFPVDATRDAPFFPRPGKSVNVPTMNATVNVREGSFQGVNVLEIPYAGGEFAMLIAQPVSAEHTLDALEQDVDGTDMVQWLAGMKPSRVRLSLPKFRIEAVSRSLKDALGTAGMILPFTQGADFSPMLGKPNLVLSDVLQAAGVIVDEAGSEASAATAATVRAKSISPPVPVRQINRPFLFSIVHRPTATPLFVGKVYEPKGAGH
ncbi:MAG TPA: serpin family protein [Burkholderiaceae bacterium]|nr:serpin family protein [Burkholderiaceae bacterium]